MFLYLVKGPAAETSMYVVDEINSDNDSDFDFNTHANKHLPYDSTESMPIFI